MNDKLKGRNRDRDDLKYNDLTKLIFQLALFSWKDFKFYKITEIDFRGMRFGVSGDRMSKFLKFDDAEPFIFTNEDEFEHYYKLYQNNYDKPHTKEYLKNWLSESANRIEKIDVLPENDPVFKMPTYFKRVQKHEINFWDKEWDELDFDQQADFLSFAGISFLSKDNEKEVRDLFQLYKKSEQ